MGAVGEGASRWGRWWIPVGAVVALVAVVVVVAAVLAGRSGSAGYDDATRQRFLADCTADGGGAVAPACECLYDRIVASVPYDRFAEVSAELTRATVPAGTPLDLPDDFEALVEGCEVVAAG